ncbi:hypothetical protein RHGRI_031392 [Rhododendron griersonianum]|uniref:Uncharacterized protein n=1 Tax=Rhododendron griersonianum TaxID=479676 RepID=A0AAV6ICD3_9ERIC|nr:hypothetical protein RHGRI_031392 [Rhododendron griersonianum]
MPIILLQTQIMELDVSYLSSKVERIIKTRNDQSLIACFGIPYRFATVASGASSGKLLEYAVGGPRLFVQTAYGMEVEDNEGDKSIFPNHMNCKAWQFADFVGLKGSKMSLQLFATTMEK